MSLGDVQQAIDPLQALLIEVARAAQAVEWFDAQVRDLDPEDLTKYEQIQKSDSQGGITFEIVWPAQNLIALWDQQRSMLAKVAGDAVKLGLAERGVRVQEAQAAMLFTILMAVLQDPQVNLSSGQLDVARTLLASRLRALEVAAIEA